MEPSQTVWQEWMDKLRRFGMADLVASILEAGSPLALIGAQAIYIGEPVLTAFWPRMNLVPLTELLENDCDFRAFIAGLRKAGER